MPCLVLVTLPAAFESMRADQLHNMVPCEAAAHSSLDFGSWIKDVPVQYTAAIGASDAPSVTMMWGYTDVELLDGTVLAGSWSRAESLEWEVR